MFNFFIINIFATTAMTAFSYGNSTILNNNNKEPQLLNILLNRIQDIEIGKENFRGWLIHYFSGFIFLAPYYLLVQQKVIPLSYLSGILFGFIAGIIGVWVWAIVFKMHPNPPETNRRVFYIQLVLAHIVFGIFSVLAFQSLI